MNLSKFLYNIVKSNTPTPILSKLDLAYSKLDPIMISFHRAKTGWKKPIPPLSLRKVTSKRSFKHYIESGQRIAKSLSEGLNVSTGKSINDFPNILDFGCGAGRQIQYFSDNKNIQLTGCDPNEAHIQWLSTEYPIANFSVSKFDPPLPFADEYFDLIYSVSVFTHLSEKAQDEWLIEIRRILRPGGIALLTTHGEHAAMCVDGDKFHRRDMHEPERLSQALFDKKFLFYVPKSYEDVNKSINPNGLSEDEMYGITWHSKEYIANHWSKYLNVVNVVPGCIDSIQDLVVLEKSRFTAAE